MANIFNQNLEDKFEKYEIVKRKLGQTNFDVKKAKEIFENAPEEINIDVFGLRKQFSIVCLIGMGYLYGLFRFSKNKTRLYMQTGYPVKILIRGVPFVLLNLALFNKSLEFIFEKLLQNKFAEKLLENEKEAEDYKSQKKLLLHQLNYFIKRKNLI
jgi:hypothetical protein